MKELEPDSLIRVLAATRTDLNKIKLVLRSAPGQMSHWMLQHHGVEIEEYQEMALNGLAEATRSIEALLVCLNDSNREV